jgi:hypothetical protein
MKMHSLAQVALLGVYVPALLAFLIAPWKFLVSCASGRGSIAAHHCAISWYLHVMAVSGDSVFNVKNATGW